MANKLNSKNYKIVRLDNGKYTIVYRDTNAKIVALNGKEIGEYDHIYEFGFLKGESNYCIVQQNNKEAILDMINNKIITDWFDRIFIDGFIEGKSNYCVVRKNHKDAILDLFNNKMTTGWYSNIFGDDFFAEKSKYPTFGLLNDKLVHFDPLNKVYKNSVINTFIMTIKFKENLWECWYKCL